jgi:hypothetical protein
MVDFISSPLPPPERAVNSSQHSSNDTGQYNFVFYGGRRPPKQKKEKKNETPEAPVSVNLSSSSGETATPAAAPAAPQTHPHQMVYGPKPGQEHPYAAPPAPPRMLNIQGTKPAPPPPQKKPGGDDSGGSEPGGKINFTV